MEPEICDDLWTAVGECRLPDVCRLVEAGTDVDQVFSKGMTLLHFAAQQGHADIVQYLTHIGADINRANDSGQTPLMTACSQHLVDLARFLVQSGANVNAVDNNLDSTLLYFIKAGTGQASRTWPSHTTPSGSLHGFYRICTSDNDCDCLDIVKLLVHAGADVNFVDSEGMTPLMRFILCKHFEVAKFLIQSGTLINQVSKEGVTALLLACQFKYSLELIEELLAAGADVNLAKTPEGSTPLMAACCGNVDSLTALIKAGALVNAATAKGGTALTYAVFARNPSAIESLIKAGARIGKELILAVIIGHGESIQTLVKNGGVPRLNGNMASLKNDIEYLSRRFNVWTSNFLQHKLLAHLDSINITSLTPLMVAMMRKDDAVAKYFVQNLFMHQFDVLLFQDFRRQKSRLEDMGVSSCLYPLITQPWSLFSLSFLCVLFSVGFDAGRENTLLLTGLPYPLQQRLLYQGRSASLPVQEWSNLELIL